MRNTLSLSAPRVALVSLGHSWIYRLFAGVRRQLFEIPDSRVAEFHCVKELNELAAWRPDGVIAHIHKREVLDDLLRLGVPIVNTSRVVDELPVPTVSPNNIAIGRLAAEHLLYKGYRSFAFVGHNAPRYAKDRLRGFAETLGRDVDDILSYRKGVPNPAIIEREQRTDAVLEFEAWLWSLPRQCGVFVADDGTCIAVIRLIQQMNLQPERRLGLVSGHDNDKPICPSITSVGISEDVWGREATKLLLQRIEDPSRKFTDIEFEASGIIERDTTRLVATSNEEVLQAVQFIRDRAEIDLTVLDVAEGIGIGRRSLERRFRDELGRTILEEIQRAHVETAKALLADTDMPLQEVGRLSGLVDVNRLIRQFKKHEGETPGAFRARFRA